MKNNIFVGLLTLTTIVIFIVCFGSLAFFFDYTYQVPNGFMPGDPVFVLTGITVIRDDHACQENIPGFVSPTDTEGSQRWYKSQRFWFPQYRELSVILNNGSIDWYPEPIVVPSPAPEELILCPTP